jgi:hypothetical protein
VFVDQTRGLMPLPFRLAGRLVLVTEFLRMHPAFPGCPGIPPTDFGSRTKESATDRRA